MEPKSDQLNADDLLASPITVTVQKVVQGPSAEQPVQIVIEGHRPFRPCKSMRRVLIACWGDNGADWVGRRMTLYCDPEVKFGGIAVGGIRISHVSDIDEPRSLMLTTTRSKRAPYVVQTLGPTGGNQADAAALRQSIERAASGAELKGAWNAVKLAYGTASSIPPDLRAAMHDSSDKILLAEIGDICAEAPDAAAIDAAKALAGKIRSETVRASAMAKIEAAEE